MFEHHPVFSARTCTRMVLTGILTLTMLSGAALAAASRPAMEGMTTRYEFHLERQALGSALTELARISGLQFARFSDIDTAQTQAVMGTYTAEQALQVMLSGSGLSYRYVNDHTIAIVRAIVPARTDVLSADTNVNDKGNGMSTHSSLYARFGALLGSWAAAFATTPVRADDDLQEIPVLEEIMVTAQKREENLQRTPIAVTAVSGDTLKSMAVTSIADVARIAPNVQFAPAIGTLSIRGIGQSQPGFLSDPGSTVFIDGVYRPRTIGSTGTFGGVQRVEVLRGPQGTLFGKNAIGGAMSIISSQPTDELHGDLEAQVGSRDRLKVDATANLPLIADTLAANVAIESNRQDGYMHNANSGEDLSDINYTASRAALLWKATDNVDLTLRADYTAQDQTEIGSEPLGNAYASADHYATYGTFPSFSVAQDLGTSLTVDWRLGSDSLKSITAYRKFNRRYSTDTDGTPDLGSHLAGDSHESFVSQELQFNGNWLDDTLKLTAGLFLMKEQLDDNQFPHLQIAYSDTYRRQTTKSYAAFAQSTYSVTSKFDVTLGLRYSRDDKDVHFLRYNRQPFFGPPGIDIDKGLTNSWNALTPKLSLQYQFTDDVGVYATASNGFKSGGFNGAPLLGATDFNAFDQETVWNYEAGLKSEWLGRRLRANLTAYRMDYKDVQLDISLPGSIQVANAGDGRMQGIEAELTVLPVESLLLNASVGSNDFKWTRLDSTVSGVKADGVLANSPKLTVNVGAEYTVKLPNANSVVLRADYAWRDKLYFDAANTEGISQDAYGLLSARLSYMSGKLWSVYAYGTNLTDKYYRLNAFDVQGVTYANPGAPREVGVGARVNFGH